MERRTRSYLQLVKPGITLSNTMTAVAGFFLGASQHGFYLPTFLGLTFGVALVIASACVVNNMLDRKLDARMHRTKGREIASGKISLKSAGLYATVLGLIGLWALIEFTMWPAAALGVIAFVWYVVIYGIAKRTTTLSTIIGAVCGALPPMAGYVAVTGDIDAVAWILFAILMVWQLPHFYAIAMFRKGDYEEAGIPVWSVIYGHEATKQQIYFWVIVFLLTSPLLTVVGATGWVYFVVSLGLGMYWVWQAARNYETEEGIRWSKRMFGSSLLVLLVLSAAIAASGYLP